MNVRRLSAVVLVFSLASIPIVAYCAEPAKYAASCGACHNTAVAGAPKPHDVSAWSSRMEKGLEAMVQSVKNGLNVMPPGGNCSDCTDAEYRTLIKFMSGPKPVE